MAEYYNMYMRLYVCVCVCITCTCSLGVNKSLIQIQAHRHTAPIVNRSTNSWSAYFGVKIICNVRLYWVVLSNTLYTLYKLQLVNNFRSPIRISVWTSIRTMIGYLICLTLQLWSGEDSSAPSMRYSTTTKDPLTSYRDSLISLKYFNLSQLS